MQSNHSSPCIKEFSSFAVTSTTSSLNDNDNVKDCDRTHAGSGIYAYWNIICCICGVGMLGLPQSLTKGGWGAVVLLIISWLMTLYCSLILIRSLYLPKPNDQKISTRLVSMPAVAKDAFGTVGYWITFAFQTTITFGLATLHFILAGANMNKLCEGTIAEIGQVPWTVVVCILVAFPFIFLKSMKDTGWTSISGAVAILTTAVICVVVAGIDKETRSKQQGSQQINAVHQNIIWQSFPAALSNISVSFSGNVTFPTIEASMKKPQQWGRVATTSLTTCVVFYIMVAVGGYYVYGESVQNPIYYSLPQGIPLIVCNCLITIAVTASIYVYLLSLTLECEEMMGITVERRGRVKEFVLRTALRSFIVFLSGVVGCTVPYFDLLMSLLGAFACSTTIFIIPVMCYWRLSGFRNKPIYELAWGVLIILFGSFGLIFGTWFAMEDLILAYQNN